jgi:hypothetical protein
MMVTLLNLWAQYWAGFGLFVVIRVLQLGSILRAFVIVGVERDNLGQGIKDKGFRR